MPDRGKSCLNLRHSHISTQIDGIIETGHGFSFGRATYRNGGTCRPLFGSFVYFVAVYRGALTLRHDDDTLPPVGVECTVPAGTG
ncbi:hypothetical protein [Chachezhania sediminis]|uniref:hypothetical protein n=1 Tax=Chachezhania sediminis TaxID=2599291 RepID=UPI00131A89E0|nr:hypothetical protein [Chachezhania sediminis]